MPTATRYTEITAGGRCYRLDRGKKALFRDKTTLHHMTEQNLEVLEFFVASPSHTLITKSQLYDHLYGKKALTDGAVPLAVKSLRNVLGKGFIEADHAKGYRFVADIKHFDEDSPIEMVDHLINNERLKGRVRRARSDLLLAGAAQGNRLLIIPTPGNYDSDDPFEEFIGTLERLGLGISSDLQTMQQLHQSVRESDINSRPKAEIRADIQRFLEHVDSVRNKVKDVLSDDDYSWFQLGSLIYSVPAHTLAHSEDNKKTKRRAPRNADAVALRILASRLQLPAEILQSINEMCGRADTGADFNELHNSAIQLLGTLWALTR
jgi:DNA-binding winged helix-turn-helix (wHTH) protein